MDHPSKSTWKPQSTSRGTMEPNGLWISPIPSVIEHGEPLEGLDLGWCGLCSEAIYEVTEACPDASLEIGQSPSLRGSGHNPHVSHSLILVRFQISFLSNLGWVFLRNTSGTNYSHCCSCKWSLHYSPQLAPLVLRWFTWCCDPDPHSWGLWASGHMLTQDRLCCTCP